jgi:hypothetical protein
MSYVIVVIIFWLIIGIMYERKLENQRRELNMRLFDIKDKIENHISQVSVYLEDLESDFSDYAETPAIRSLEANAKQMMELYKDDPTFGLSLEEALLENGVSENFEKYKSYSDFIDKKYDISNHIESIKEETETMQKFVEDL